jgi:hypothetical protein
VTSETRAANQPLREKSLGVTASVAKPDDFARLRVGYIVVSTGHANAWGLLYRCTPLEKGNRQDLGVWSATRDVDRICHCLGARAWEF